MSGEVVREKIYFWRLGMKAFMKIMHILSLLSAVIFLSTGCGSNKAGVEATAKAEVRKNQGVQKVRTAVVELKDFHPTLQATGTLVPRQHAKIRALVGGDITSLPVDIGTHVQKGQLLFEIRTIDYQLDVEQADANLARAQVMVKDREREKNRIENLFNAGSATEQMRDQAISGYEESLAAIKQAQAARDRANQMLTDCTINAPFSGVITARFYQQGEYARSGDDIVELMDLTVLNAEMEIPEPYAGKIKAGLPVTVSFLSEFKPVEGKVVAVNPKIDTTNRTFLVKVSVNNSDGRLHAGLYCTAAFSLAVEKNNPSVPAEAIIRDEGRSMVWVVSNGIVHSREIKEGSKMDGNIMILKGLQPGEKVVISGYGGLTEGVPISEN